MLDKNRATFRTFAIAVPACAALLIGTAYLGLEWGQPDPTAASEPPPVAATTVTSAEAPAAPAPPETAPPAKTAAPVKPPPAHAATEPQAAPSVPEPSEPEPVDVTKVNPGQLNLPGSGPFRPAPYVPPPPDWVPPAGWTFVPPQELNLGDAGMAASPPPAPEE